jgi:hypothetical protein
MAASPASSSSSFDRFRERGLLGHTSSPLMGYLAMLVGLTMIFVA